MLAGRGPPRGPPRMPPRGPIGAPPGGPPPADLMNRAQALQQKQGQGEEGKKSKSEKVWEEINPKKKSIDPILTIYFPEFIEEAKKNEEDVFSFNLKKLRKLDVDDVSALINYAKVRNRYRLKNKNSISA